MSSTANNKRTFNKMNTNRKNLLSYEDVRDVFVSRKESRCFFNGNSFRHGKQLYF